MPNHLRRDTLGDRLGFQEVGEGKRPPNKHSPVLNCPKYVRRRSMIRFLIELLVRRTWFGLFDELYIVLSWLVMRCKLRPELAADAQQTA